MSNEDGTVMAPKKDKQDSRLQEADPEKAAAVEEKIQKTLINMLIRHAFWGTLACRFKLVNATTWLPTMAVDGKNLYYNVHFVHDELSVENLKFVLAHEILHCAYEHFLRKDMRDAQLWNVACDYAVNADLKHARVGEMPEVGLYDKKYDGSYAESIYDDLLKNAEENRQLQAIDTHLDLNGDDEDGDGDGDQDGQQGQDGPEKMSKSEAKRISDEFKNAMIQAAQQSGAGDLPAGLQRLIKKWTEPQMDWREYLQATIPTVFKDDFTFMKRSRKDMGGDIMFPGLKNADTVQVSIAVDTSGSMSEDQLADLMGEIRGIMEQHTDFEVHVWSFDTNVYQHQVFTESNLEQMEEYPLTGGGGTDFMCNWRYMEEIGHVPEILMVFTDGMPCGEWGNPDYTDTIFLIHGNRDVEAPFGITLQYEKESKKAA